MEMRGGFRTAVTPDLAAFLAQVDSAVLSTANALGQPYAQHRGGPKGFIKVIDDTTLGFADYSGNKQYITLGNLAENNRAFLLLIDYATGRRIKLWGHARVVDDDPEMLGRLMPPGYDGEARAGDRVLDRRVGHELPAAHSAEVRRRGRGEGARGMADQDNRARKRERGAAARARRGASVRRCAAGEPANASPTPAARSPPPARACASGRRR